MLTDIEVEDYQSLRRVSLKLGGWTVVTGPTGSGKSAVIRAMRLVAGNARGTSYIRHGAKAAKAAIGCQDEGWVAGIERGGRGKDAYRVATPGEGGQPSVREFTKLGGAVPPEVTALLRLSGLNFAGQFDRPYLLDSSGGEIARVLGALTNVTLLFNAAREANRRRLGIAGDLKRAQQQLADARDRIQFYADLKDRRASVSAAEEALERLEVTSQRAGALRALLGRFDAAQEALAQVQAGEAQAPDGGRLEELWGRRAALASLLGQLDAASGEAELAQREEESWTAQAAALEEHHHQILAEAGRCPTCGQEISEEHSGSSDH